MIRFSLRSIVVYLLLLLPLTVGCKEKKTAEKNNDPLVPTARETEILRAYNLSADTEIGQTKLRKLRERQEKLEKARERMTKWAEEAEKRKAEKEAAGN